MTTFGSGGLYRSLDDGFTSNPVQLPLDDSYESVGMFIDENCYVRYVHK